MEFPQTMIEQAQQRTQGKQWEGFVSGEGPSDARLMLVGESPGAEEVAQGRTFVGKAGGNLNEFIAFLNIRREDLYVTNTTKSRPLKIKTIKRKDGTERRSKSNRPPSRLEIDAHAPLLDYEIKRIDPEVMITLGNVPLKRILGDTYKISNCHGELIAANILHYDPVKEAYVPSEKRYRVFPLYHPAAIIYRRELKEVYYRDLEQLKKILTAYSAETG